MSLGGFSADIYSQKLRAEEIMSVLERASSNWSMFGGALFLITFCLTKIPQREPGVCSPKGHQPLTYV
jgi:hypothetical protein